MKKSATILLSVTMALAACRNEVSDDWVDGKNDPNSRDTVVQGRQYRSYYGSYYPVYRGMISPSSYRGGSMNEISSPSYSPSKVTRGGFGSRSRVSS